MVIRPPGFKVAAPVRRGGGAVVKGNWKTDIPIAIVGGVVCTALGYWKWGDKMFDKPEKGQSPSQGGP